MQKIPAETSTVYVSLQACDLSRQSYLDIQTSCRFLDKYTNGMNHSNRAEAIGRLAALTGVHWKLPKCTAMSSHELLLMDHPKYCEKERLLEDVGAWSS